MLNNEMRFLMSYHINIHINLSSWRILKTTHTQKSVSLNSLYFCTTAFCSIVSSCRVATFLSYTGGWASSTEDKNLTGKAIFLLLITYIHITYSLFPEGRMPRSHPGELGWDWQGHAVGLCTLLDTLETSRFRQGSGKPSQLVTYSWQTGQTAWEAPKTPLLNI